MIHFAESRTVAASRDPPTKKKLTFLLHTVADL